MVIQRASANQFRGSLEFCLTDSEAEAGLDEAFQLLEALPFRGDGSQGPAQVEERWRDANVVCELELVPPLPNVISVIGSDAPFQACGKGSLAHSHTKGVPLKECILSFQTDAPGLTGAHQSSILHHGLVVGGVDSPPRTD